MTRINNTKSLNAWRHMQDQENSYMSQVPNLEQPIFQFSYQHFSEVLTILTGKWATHWILSEFKENSVKKKIQFFLIMVPFHANNPEALQEKGKTTDWLAG